ncbi:MAG: dTDP-4-dehydrorhamnose 3,5-epimerase [Acidobacteria bacterium]|nr:dTDP-4-dehydrorhamnose 3,5-epimerase [Acidobacteriota bacterium]
MIFTETKLRGAFVVEPERHEDERGFLALSWSRDEFAARGLSPDLVQCNISFSAREGTLRGMHFQAAPHAQAKLVRCTAGAVFDCIIDLREGSETFARWFAVELTAENRLQLYVPEGFAHGFQTLADESEVFYQMSSVYVPESARGVRWDDPAFGINWPEAAERTINLRDRTYPDFVR